jgi:hypothetical protein
LVVGEARTLKKNASCWPVRLVENALSRALPTARWLALSPGTAPNGVRSTVRSTEFGL